MRFFKITLCALLLLLCVFGAACSADPPTQSCDEGHSFEAWQVTKKESCGVAGERAATCTRCGETQTEVIPATGEHRPGGYVTVTPATVSEKGEKTQYCERCHLAVDSKEIPALRETVYVTESGEKTALSLAGYTLVYDDGNDNAFYQSAMLGLHAALEEYAGTTLTLLPRSRRSNNPPAKEILVGANQSAETESALNGISGSGFTVTLTGGKLVIVGTDLLQTVRAIQYFQYTYLPDGASGEGLEIDTHAVADHAAQCVWASDGESELAVVFSRELDNDPAHKHLSSANYSGDSRDYPCVAAEELAAYMRNTVAAEAECFPVRNDETFTEYELLIGTFPARKEVEAFRAMLQGHEYGILVQDNKIILTAHNDLALAECLAQFRALLPLCEYVGENGEMLWGFPDGFCAVAALETDWITDFPQPAGEGIGLYNTFYCNDDSLQYLYTGSGICADSYRNYCQTLLSAGYTRLTENEIEDSCFSTFVHTQKRITLYVTYHDYKHEAAYAKDDKYAVDYERSIRVISAPLDSVTLPDAGLLTKDPFYGKVTESSITALPFSGKAVGMGYVIRLEDGRFVVIDGGGINDGGGTEHDQLWQVLCSLYEDTYGRAPSSTDPIRIAAWINTHSHWDHYYAFSQMLKKYGPTGQLRMEYLLGNFPEKSAIYAVSGSTLVMGKGELIETMQSYVVGGFRYVKVHTGQRFYLANLTLDILMTFEDHNPRRICNSNDTCTVVRMAFTRKDAAADATPITAVFLADAFRFQSRFLCAMYGSYLKSDIVQLAHHGNIGCEKDVYTAISPTVVFFPNTYTAYKKYTQSNNSTWNYQVDRYVVNQLESVQYIYVADQTPLCLRLGEGGPDYAGIFCPTTGLAIAYNGTSIVNKAADASP